MQCRNCGAEIADKALICYKCGTATTEAKYQPAKLPRLVALALRPGGDGHRARPTGRLGDLCRRVSGAGSDTSQRVTYLAVAAAVIIIGIRAYARRR